jgi:hypothetical protein
MRSKLLLALFAVPVLCAALPGAAAAQFREYRYREHGRVHRDYHGYSRGYRDRIYISAHRYKEPERRYRAPARVYNYNYRYRDGYDYRYRNDYRYRDGYRRRRTTLLDLVLVAAGAHHRDRYAHRHNSRCRHRR